MTNNEYLFKICAIGSGGVGKTSLIRRYAENKFDKNYLPTLGVDITTRKITVGNKEVKLILVDTAGQEFFGKLRPSYYRGANACLIMFALDDEKSFISVPDWITEFRKNTKKDIPIKVPIALAGNKKDKEQERKVSYEEANELAESYDMVYYETSAKNGGPEIEEIFLDLAKRSLTEQKI